MEMLVYDLEANGLLDEATTVHCLVISDLKGNQTSYVGSDIPKGISRLNSASTIVCHNQLAYDIPLVAKLFDVNLDGPGVTDSYILSQMLFSHEMRSHGLAAWGLKFGIPKPKHEDWSVFSKAMLVRCQEDVKINVKLYQLCLDEGFSRDSLDLEQNVYRLYNSHRMSQVYLNVGKARHLENRLETLFGMLTDRLQVKLGYVVSKPYNPFKAIYKKDGSIRKSVANYMQRCGMSIYDVDGPFSSVEFKLVNLASAPQLTKKLLERGWKPNGKTPSGSPSLRDSAFNGLPAELKKHLGKIRVVQHRLGLARGLLSKTNDDGLCQGHALTSGANTSRFQHRIITNIPRP